MLSCKDVSKIISESFDKKLPLSTRVRLRVHLMMCKLCCSLRETMTLIESEVRRQTLDRQAVDPTVPKLSDAARERINESLRA